MIAHGGAGGGARLTAEELAVLDQMWSDLDPHKKERLELEVVEKKRKYEQQQQQQQNGAAADGDGASRNVYLYACRFADHSDSITVPPTLHPTQPQASSISPCLPLSRGNASRRI